MRGIEYELPAPISKCTIFSTTAAGSPMLTASCLLLFAEDRQGEGVDAVEVQSCSGTLSTDAGSDCWNGVNLSKGQAVLRTISFRTKSRCWTQADVQSPLLGR